MQLFRQFGTIAKIEEQEDGTIKVYGVASSGGRDTSGEIVKPEAMAAALPDYARFPALREMHQPLAAGKVLEADVDGEGVTNIVAHVVDPLAVTKVKTGVYAGFSIGGKVTARDPADRSIITGLRLVEISLVDSPCNPDAILSMWKADMTIYTPPSDAVVARAKTLAKAANTARFRDFLFEAREELVSEYILEKGDIVDPNAEAEEAAAPDTVEAVAAVEPPAGVVEEAPAGEAAAEEPEAVVEAPAGETAAVEAEAAADVPQEPETIEAAAPAEAVTGEPDEDDHAGEGDVAEVAAAAADPAAVITAAVEKGNAVIDAAAPPAGTVEEAAADPFADLGKAATALKGITSENPLLAKSLWHVERLADIISDFASLQTCVNWEAESEKDNSPIPAEMANQLKTMGATLVAMAKEEVAELISEITTDEGAECVIVYAGDEVMLSQGIVDLVKADTALIEKAGARNSKTDSKHIQAAHDSLVKIGAACDVENCDKGADGEAITTLTTENERLTKALADAAPAVEAMVTKFTGIIEPLQAEVAELRKRFNDEPLPPKTAGPAVIGQPVSKAADSTGNGADPDTAAQPLTDEQFQKAWDALPEEERGQILLKVALSRPQPIQARLSA